MLCEHCKKETNNPKFCSRSCAAIVNNSKMPKRKKREGLENCLRCNTKLGTNQYKFCSKTCSSQYIRDVKIQSWLSGEISGLNSLGNVISSVKEWLRETRNNRCEKCGWSEINIYTNKVPLVADHIDGNNLNNRPENLQLICNNCDSLQPTYKASNKNSGRIYRRSTS